MTEHFSPPPITVIPTGLGGLAIGTLIETGSGPHRVEHLMRGDLVKTLDHGFIPLRDVRVTACPVIANRPIKVAKNAIAPGVPARDTVLAPSHKLLLTNWKAQMYFGQDDVLVPAKYMLNDDTITSVDAVGSYLHLAFDHTAVLFANDMPVESADPAALGMRDAGGIAPYERPCLNRAEVRVLLAA